MTVSSSPLRHRQGTNRTNKLRFVVIFRHTWLNLSSCCFLIEPTFFRSDGVPGQLSQGFARHDFLPFISHFGSSEFLPVRADVEWPPAVGRAGCFGGGWEAGWFSGLEFCRSFPAPTRISAEEKKLFTRDTARNYRAKLTSGLGEQQNPAPSRGTRKTSSARRGGGEEGASADSLGRATGAPALPTAAGPSRGDSRGAGAGWTSAALGRRLLLHAVPTAGRRGYCLDSACRALRPRRRPGPGPRGRAG